MIDIIERKHHMTVAKIFTTGRSQAVRLPKEFRFRGKEVCIKRIGSVVVLYDPRDRMKLFMNALGKATEDFMVERAQPKAADRRHSL
jgi:antitoxin VapB